MVVANLGVRDLKALPCSSNAQPTGIEPRAKDCCESYLGRRRGGQNAARIGKIADEYEKKLPDVNESQGGGGLTARFREQYAFQKAD